MKASAILTLAPVACLTLMSVVPVHAQVILGSIETFDAVPPLASWASKGYAGSGTTIGSLTDAQNAVNLAANAASTFTTRLASVTTSANSSGPAAVNTSTHLLEIGPTGNAATLVLAQVANQTGHDVSGFRISYDLVKNSGTVVAEQVPLEVFYSLSGLAGSWTRIAALAGEVGTTLVHKQADLTLSTPWANNTSLYVMWADDNANPGTDNIYRMDNVGFTNPVPEPSTYATVGGLALIAFASARRLRKA